MHLEMQEMRERCTRLLYKDGHGAKLTTMARQNARTRWVFTLNNPRQANMDAVEAMEHWCDWYVWQVEKGESGTIHLQGVLHCDPKRRLSAVVKLLAGTLTDKKFSADAETEAR